MLRVIKWRTTLIFAFFTVISPFIMIITNSFLSVMLGFNLFLAYVPLYIIWLLRYLLEKNNYRIQYYHFLLFLLFVLFLPNTFYVITDAIHLNSSLFYTYEHLYAPSTYLRDIKAYVMLIHIIVTILLGLYAGAESLVQLRRVMDQLSLKVSLSRFIHFMIIVLSSIGIYIGRII